MRQNQPIRDQISRFQVETLAKNAQDFGLTYYGLNNPKNGIVHVIGPENGYTQPLALKTAAPLMPKVEGDANGFRKVFCITVLGKYKRMPVYRFLREPLIRCFGSE